MEARTFNKNNFVRVLVFDQSKRLVSICHSLTSCGNMFNVSRSAIYNACNGRLASSCGFYFRFLDDTIEVTWEDLGTLSVTEYDDLCGVKRVYKKFNPQLPKGAKRNK